MIFKRALSSSLAALIAVQTLSSAVQGSVLPPERAFAILTPPQNIASLVSTSRLQPQESLPKVIVVQDLHLNYSVQRHIAQLLNFLAQKGALGPSIAVEGAAGPVDNSILTAVQNQKVRAEVADMLMQNGELT